MITKFSILLAIVAALAPAARATAAELANMSAVQTDLEQRVLAVYPHATVSVSVVVPELGLLATRGCKDPRHTITAKQITGPIPVRIHCQNIKPWSFYLQSQVSAEQEVLVAKHNLMRGEALGRENLTTALLPIMDGAFTNVADVAGFTAKRALRQGRQIRLNDLIRPHAVKQGDMVTIQARHGGAFITSSGVALRSGHIGEQISVRNSTSKRIVHPWVVRSGVVATAR